MAGERVLTAGGAPFARVITGAPDLPVIAFALHAGHELRPELASLLASDAPTRLREEDPHTAAMAPAGVALVEVLRSRFEVDLNRPRFRSVYQNASDAWGIPMWRGELPDAQDRISRAVYDAFYAEAFELLSHMQRRHGHFIVLDLHSYNHRRDGQGAPPANSLENPEINLGTGRIDRQRWEPVVTAFSETMTSAGFEVGENVKFLGGHFCHWVAETFPEHGCPLAIEFKKTYMDEWTGEVDEDAVARISVALGVAVPALVASLRAVE